MGNIILSAVTLGLVDSLNPIAISEQFVLQGMVKKTRHIWFFIVAVGFTNFLSGIAVYYGLNTLLENFWASVMTSFGTYIYAGLVALGIGFILMAARSVFRLIRNKEKRAEDSGEKTIKIKSVSPSSLVMTGVISTLAELTSALPYFAFLAVLLSYKVTLWQLIIILLIYNIIYSLPFYIMYFLYIRAKDKFNRMYEFLKAQIEKWSQVLKPVFLTVVGGFLTVRFLMLLI